MPLPGRIVYDAKSMSHPQLFDETSAESALFDVDMSSILGAFHQVIYATAYIAETFDNIIQLADSTNDRVVSLSRRATALTQKLPSFEARVFSAELCVHGHSGQKARNKFLAQRESYIPTVLTRTTSSSPIMDQYHAAQPLPQFWKLVAVTQQDTTVFYSNPGFFFHEWLKGEQIRQANLVLEQKKQKMLRKQMKKEKKKQRLLLMSASQPGDNQNNEARLLFDMVDEAGDEARQSVMTVIDADGVSVKVTNPLRFSSEEMKRETFSIGSPMFASPRPPPPPPPPRPPSAGAARPLSTRLGLSDPVLDTQQQMLRDEMNERFSKRKSKFGALKNLIPGFGKKDRPQSSSSIQPLNAMSRRTLGSRDEDDNDDDHNNRNFHHSRDEGDQDRDVDDLADEVASVTFSELGRPSGREARYRNPDTGGFRDSDASDGVRSVNGRFPSSRLASTQLGSSQPQQQPPPLLPPPTLPEVEIIAVPPSRKSTTKTAANRTTKKATNRTTHDKPNLRLNASHVTSTEKSAGESTKKKQTSDVGGGSVTATAASGKKLLNSLFKTIEETDDFNSTGKSAVKTVTAALKAETAASSSLSKRMTVKDNLERLSIVRTRTTAVPSAIDAFDMKSFLRDDKAKSRAFNIDSILSKNFVLDALQQPNPTPRPKSIRSRPSTEEPKSPPPRRSDPSNLGSLDDDEPSSPPDDDDDEPSSPPDGDDDDEPSGPPPVPKPNLPMSPLVNVLSQIRSGAQLKKVEVDQPPKIDVRGLMLSAIKGGNVALKKVELAPRPKDVEQNGAVSKILANRLKIAGSDSEDSDSDSDSNYSDDDYG